MPPVGGADVTWALEWDYSDPSGLYSMIAPGGSKIISKDKHLDVTIVPEPSVLALLGLALGGLGAFRKRRA